MTYTHREIQTAKWLASASQHGPDPQAFEYFLNTARQLNTESAERMARPCTPEREPDVTIQNGLYEIGLGVE